MAMVRYSAEQVRAMKPRLDRRKLRSMTEARIERLARAEGTDTGNLDLPAAVARGEWRIAMPLDVAKIRARTGLSQDRFARAFRISPHTLRNWEQGRRAPEGPARALLMAIARSPKALMKALQA